MNGSFDKHLEMACASQGTVLLVGETGTGKSTLARLIHQRSARRSGPFVSVNLAVLHEGTLESELFGHEKGSFTGADHKRTGYLEAAHGGTVFLDEIGDLSLRFQARLLEFLQSRTIRSLGGKAEIKLDVRIIAATHRNLAEAVKKREFREDLFHRLRVLPVHLKPLRERMDQLDSLVHSYLSEITVSQQRTIHRISAGVAQKLENHRWPGNLRELRNVLEYAVLASQGPEIELDHLPSWLFESERSWELHEQEWLGQLELPLSWSYQKTLESFEKQYFQRALSRNGGRMARTAHQIGLNKSTFLRRVRAYGLRQEAPMAHRIKKMKISENI